ncbi:MAG: heme exporter protein CcmB, partial [Pseudomonadota bacterium]
MWAIFLRELRLRLRGGGWAASLGLFSVFLMLSPLALGRDLSLLSNAAPALLWLTASLALLVGLDGLFEEDLRNGGLSLYRLTPLPLSMIILLKMAAGWVAACGPLILAAPALYFFFGVEPMLWGMAGFAVGTPALALLAGTIGALCAGLRRGAALLVFLCLPLFTPALVFGPASAGESPFV